jgi:Mg2+ and Co2+ transporter CorA
MNTPYIPLIKQPGGWWVVIGMMVTIMIIAFLFFRGRKWL